MEDEILGTGGPLVNAREFLSKGDCFLLHNGDILTNLDVGELVQTHVNGPQKVTMVLLDGPENKLDVSVDENGNAVINDILGKLGRGQPSDRKFTYAGIAVFSNDIFDYLPEQPEFCSIITAILKLMENDPTSVAGFIPDEFTWNDLGTVETFLTANQRHLENSFLRESSQREGFEVKRLAEQGSNRAFYRISANGQTRVLMRSSADDADFDRFNEFGHLFGALDLPTPRLYGWNADNHTVLMEDLGDTTLNRFVNSNASAIRLKLTYGSVVETLIDYQLRASQALKKSGLSVREFDYDYLRWETHYFKTQFLEGHLGFEPDATERLDDELHQLAEEALGLPRLFLHRDFQSQNIMLMGDTVRLVDFQGGRWGPYTYDLVSLVYDPYVQLNDELVKGLLALYRNRLVATGEVPVHPGEFADHVRIAALQRLMQALGAYGFLSHVKGKTQYLQYIAPALDRLLANLKGRNDFPNLRRMVNRAIASEGASSGNGHLIECHG